MPAAYAKLYTTSRFEQPENRLLGTNQPDGIVTERNVDIAVPNKLFDSGSGMETEGPSFKVSNDVL